MSDDKKLPALKNPMNDLMLNGMPNLPDIIRNATPVNMPQAKFEDGVIRLWWDNKKRTQLVTSTKAEAEIATAKNVATQQTMDSMKRVVLYSSEIADGLHEYEHRQRVRIFLEERLALENSGLILENKKKEFEIFKVQAEAALMGHEAASSELDVRIKQRQCKEMYGED